MKTYIAKRLLRFFAFALMLEGTMFRLWVGEGFVWSELIWLLAALAVFSGIGELSEFPQRTGRIKPLWCAVVLTAAGWGLLFATKLAIPGNRIVPVWGSVVLALAVAYILRGVRGLGYPGALIFVASALPLMLLVWHFRATTGFVLLGLVYAAIFGIAAACGWFSGTSEVRPTILLGAGAGFLLCLLQVWCGINQIDGLFLRRVLERKIAPTALTSSVAELYNSALRRIVNEAEWMWKSGAVLDLFFEQEEAGEILRSAWRSFPFALLLDSFGWVPAAAAVLPAIGVLSCLIVLSWERNLSWSRTAAALILSGQILVYLSQNFGFVVTLTEYLPFFSNGIPDLVVTAVLLMLVLTGRDDCNVSLNELRKTAGRQRRRKVGQYEQCTQD